MISRDEQPGDLQIGEAVLALTLSQRKGLPKDFPLTGGWVQRISRKLGTPVGEHRALRIVRVLEKRKKITVVGSYRQAYRSGYPSGWRVRLHRLTRVARKVQASIRTPWWQHALFGTPDGKPPPGTTPRQRKWRE